MQITNLLNVQEGLTQVLQHKISRRIRFRGSSPADRTLLSFLAPPELLKTVFTDAVTAWQKHRRSEDLTAHGTRQLFHRERLHFSLEELQKSHSTVYSSPLISSLLWSGTWWMQHDRNKEINHFLICFVRGCLWWSCLHNQTECTARIMLEKCANTHHKIN